MKANELESRLELEKTTRSRLEVQFNRYKDALEKAQQEASATKAKEQTAQDALKKVQKSLRLVYTISLRIDNSTRIKFTISVFFFVFSTFHYCAVWLDHRFSFSKCRELREEHHLQSNRENDNVAKRKDLEQKNSNAESEISSLKNDLRLALQRIADLQQAMEEGDEDNDASSDR